MGITNQERDKLLEGVEAILEASKKVKARIISGALLDFCNYLASHTNELFIDTSKTRSIWCPPENEMYSRLMDLLDNWAGMKELDLIGGDRENWIKEIV